MSWVALLACLGSAVFAATVSAQLLRPTPRLAPRVRPYTVASRAALGRPAPAVPPSGLLTAGTLQALLAPLVLSCAEALGRMVDSSSDTALLRKLRQAGLFSALPEAQRVAAYRVRQLGQAAGFTTAFAAVGLGTGHGGAAAVALAVLGFVVGSTRWRARVDRAIEERQLRMQLELYTVNQLLAMTMRAGAGVVQAIQRVVDRGHGEIVGELAEALALHRSGRRLRDALEHIARVTPEPQAARTYKLLANGVELGADLAEALRALSTDVRAQRGEALERAATRRRAAMLVPIIGLLAPTMLLFIAAPLPSIVFGG